MWKALPVDDRRRPRWVYSRGSEPDPRFSLANERTFLAWIRTTLALAAAGVALLAVDVPIRPVLRDITALTFVGLSILAAVHGWLGWARTERALREQRPLGGHPLVIVIVAGIVLGVALLFIGLIG